MAFRVPLSTPRWRSVTRARSHSGRTDELTAQRAALWVLRVGFKGTFQALCPTEERTWLPQVPPLLRSLSSSPLPLLTGPSPNGLLHQPRAVWCEGPAAWARRGRRRQEVSATRPAGQPPCHTARSGPHPLSPLPARSRSRVGMSRSGLSDETGLRRHAREGAPCKQ